MATVQTSTHHLPLGRVFRLAQPSKRASPYIHMPKGVWFYGELYKNNSKEKTGN